MSGLSGGSGGGSTGDNATATNQESQIVLEQHTADDLDYIASNTDLIETDTANTANNTSNTATNTSTLVTNTTGLAKDATLTGGTAKTIIRGGTKGITVPVDITATSISSDHSGVDVVEGMAPVAENNSLGVIAYVHKPLASSVYAPSLFTNFGANNTLNVKSSTGNIFSFSCQNLNISARFIQFYNTATVPVNGNTPILSFSLPGTSTIIIGSDFFTSEGINFSTGLAFAFSTTNSTLTLGAAGDHSTQVVYF